LVLGSTPPVTVRLRTTPTDALFAPRHATGLTGEHKTMLTDDGVKYPSDTTMYVNVTKQTL